MTCNLYIDGEDAFDTFGAALLEGAYASLLTMPSFKRVYCNEWDEYDGVEPELSAPVLNSRTLTLPMYITDASRAASLVEHLRDNTHHSFKVPELNDRAWTLRMTANDDFVTTSEDGFAKIAISFSEDTPAVPTDKTASIAVDNIVQAAYWIDGVNLNELGCLVLKGTEGSVRKAARIRTPLSYDSVNNSGVLYDERKMHYGAKEIVIKCFIHADIEQFLARYDTLFYKLMQPGERDFRCSNSSMAVEWMCYYKNSSINRLFVSNNGDVWCEFVITLAITCYL